MLVPVDEYKSGLVTARLSQENGTPYVDVEFDIEKLKNEYPFGLPNKVTTHVPISFGITLLDEPEPEILEKS